MPTGVQVCHLRGAGGFVPAGSGSSSLHIYRVRLTLGASGNCTYEIQSGPQYPAIGSASWTDITPRTSSATTTLYAGIVAANASDCYVGDVKIY